MNPKLYPFPFPLAIHVSLRGCTLLLCFIVLGWTQSTAQNRSTLEAKRMEIFQSVEQVETALSQTRNKKSRILSRINEIERRIDHKDFGVAAVTTVTDLTPSTKPVALPQRTATTIAEPTLPQADLNSDYAAAYNALLQQHVRTKILNRGQANVSPEDIQRQLREASYIKSLREYIDQNPVASVESDPLPDYVSNEPIEEEPRVAEPTTASVTTETELKEEMRKLLNQAAALTDNEITLRADLIQLQATVESINVDLDQAIRSSLTLQSTSPISSNTKTPTTTAPAVTLPQTNYSNIDYKKGFLPWPIKDAKVVARYGQQQHSSTFNVFVNNNGVDLESYSTNVLSIYDGDILSITYDDKGLATIIVQHSGDVYSVYSKLVIARVEQGQSVNQGQLLGAASERTSGLANLHFEIWKGQESENPQHWLKNN